MKKLWKKLKRAISYYILGYYHCDKCPWCWEEEMSYDGDCDAGCYARGDTHETCRLLPPIRAILGYFGKKRQMSIDWSIYEDLVAENEEEERKFKLDMDFVKIINSKLESNFVYTGEGSQTGDPYYQDNVVFEIASELRKTYEKMAEAAQVPTPLKTRWKNLISDTLKSFRSTLGKNKKKR